MSNDEDQFSEPEEEFDEVDDDVGEAREGDRREELEEMGLLGNNDNEETMDEEEEGEDLMENLEGDRIEYDAELDNYDENDEMIDGGEQRELSHAARSRAERELAARDRREGRGRKANGAEQRFYGALDDLFRDDEQEDEQARHRRRRRERLREAASAATRPDPQQAQEAIAALPPCGKDLQMDEQTKNKAVECLEKILRGFIYNYKRSAGGLATGDEANPSDQQRPKVDSGQGTYLKMVHSIVRASKTSLGVEWEDLLDYCGRLSEWFMWWPHVVLGVFDDVATVIVQEFYPQLYENTQIYVRIRNFNSGDNLRNLRTDSLNKLVGVEGVCLRRTAVFPRLKVVYLECVKCHCKDNGPFEKLEEGKQLPRHKCQDCQSNGPFFISRERTVYENYQKIVVQEPPGAVDAGRIPRQKTVVLLADLVDTVRPGEELFVTGIHQIRHDTDLNARSGFPIFSTLIIANNAQRRGDIKMQSMTDQDIDVIKRLARNRNIRDKVIDSIAPSIWGHRHIKTAIAYSMFGGERKQSAEKGHTIRGDINVLIVGDPGMAKSQFLKYVENTFDRTVYTTGKGASAVGLTAAVKRDPMSGDWTLEGGALVLADEGICMIDEFDKMSEKDRVSIHEAMEQQSISISKAGIVTTLRARCAIIAAANPVFGRYDNSLTFAENVDLSDPILSRFDVLAVVKDQPNDIQDEYLSEFVVESHVRSHPDRRHATERAEQKTQSRVFGGHVGNEVDMSNVEEWVKGSGPIPQEMLRKYVFYARQRCHPVLQTADRDKLSSFYSEIRQAAHNTGGLPMTVRHLESILRMATANAKIRLAHRVEKRDLDFAISTMLESFIQSQKHAVAQNLSRRFGRYRAVAASPEEFVETLLCEIINRRSRHQRQLINLKGNDGEAAREEEFAVETESAPVKVNVLRQLATTLYAIPDTLVDRYMVSDRFKSKFRTETLPASPQEGIDEPYDVIRRRVAVST
eukprot:GHVN01001927.1.p2 GENE.GHVN01001927.1~~GHVN01001927.1.p2  ORF type:complete len:972 (-),score=132.09 GHVN01001927.1:14507-17422(-)